MNCGIFAVFMVIILNIIGNILSIAQKHNRQNFEHNMPGLTLGASTNATNLIVHGELRCTPLSVCRKVQVVSYWQI